MTEALPLGLNYGHVGEPTYDIESHEWHFPRQLGISRKFRPIGEPLITIRPASSHLTGDIQTSIQRSQNIKDIIAIFPELAPSASLLPGFAQISEVVNGATAAYDPTVSDLFAFGEAVHRDSKGYGAKNRPIAAVAAGVAGEAVRLVLLINEKLGWEGSKYIRLSTFTAKGSEEGWWVGNNSPIQQLVFAETEGRPSSWLAVRYYGAISVLQPVLRRDAESWKTQYKQGVLGPLCRLGAEHIVTLSVERGNGVPFSDVAFNPWNHQQISTIDQMGHFSIWDLAVNVKRSKLWGISKRIDGSLLDGLNGEDEEDENVRTDGWGAVLWVGNENTLIVAGRRRLSVFDIKRNPQRLLAPRLVSERTSDWILDVKRSRKDSSHIFVVTSSSVFWLSIIGSEAGYSSESAGAGAKCLLFWRHFRDEVDTSLRLHIVDDSEKKKHVGNRDITNVVLYSRLTSLTTVFSFQIAGPSSNRLPSAADPYSLPLLAEHDLGLRVSKSMSFNTHINTRISGMFLRAVKYDSPYGSTPTGKGQLISENGAIFYQLSLLFNNLQLSERLYVEASTDSDELIHAPVVFGRSKIAKTTAKVVNEFIVPDGYVDNELGDLLQDPTNTELSSDNSDVEYSTEDQDPRTIRFEWLGEEINSALLESPNANTVSKVIELVRAEIELRLASGVSSIDTLLCLGNSEISVLHIDEEFNEITHFLKYIKSMTSEKHQENETEAGIKLTTLDISTPSMSTLLGFNTFEITSVYEALVQTWIAPLPTRVPSRARIALEKLLRDIAAEICLASHALYLGPGLVASEENTEGVSTGVGPRFDLPMRRRPSAASLGKGKEKELERSSPALPSSQVSEDVGFLPPSPFQALPTPEPTPSLHSRSSVSSFAGSEAAASQRLQAFAKITPQPSLPSKMSNLLGQWQLGADPAFYNWEAAQQTADSEDESENQSRAKQRQRQRNDKRRKRHKEHTVGPSSQPSPKRLGGSQPQLAKDTQEDSQRIESLVTNSQVEPGRFGGRPTKVKKSKAIFGTDLNAALRKEIERVEERHQEELRELKERNAWDLEEMKRRLDQSHILEMDALRLDMLEDHRRDLAELRHAFGNFARFALANLQEQRFLAFSPFTSKDSSPPPTESALPNDSAISSSDAQISSSGGSSDSITRTLMPSPSVRFLPTTISLANAGHAVVVKRDTEGPDAATTAAMREVDVGQEVQAGISDVRGGDGGDEEGIAEVREGPKKTVKSKNGLKWLKGFTKVVWKERRGRRSSRLLESDE